jgi:hypothetical protein
MIIQQLYDYIKVQYPEAIQELTAPLRKDGVWFLDVDLGETQLAIQYSVTGFGISSVRDDSYGEGADEIFISLMEIQKRVDYLLLTGEKTVACN